MMYLPPYVCVIALEGKSWIPQRGSRVALARRWEDPPAHLASSAVKVLPVTQACQFAPGPRLSTIMVPVGSEGLLANQGPNPRRWTVIASALLCGVLAVVVMFTNRSAFFSPLAVVVVAAIGSAALLLRIRLRSVNQRPMLHPPIWLNLLGIAFALAALLADFLGLSPQVAQVMALGAVSCFGVSGAIILHAFRKARAVSKG